MCYVLRKFSLFWRRKLSENTLTKLCGRNQHNELKAKVESMVLKSEPMRGDQHLQNAANNKPPLRMGARNSGVAIMQQCLMGIGYPMPITTKNGTAKPDGVFGQETQKAVQRFQRDQGLSPDGIAGRDTLHRLDQLMAIEPEVSKPGPLHPTLAGIDQVHWRLCAMWT